MSTMISPHRRVTAAVVVTAALVATFLVGVGRGGIEPVAAQEPPVEPITWGPCEAPYDDPELGDVDCADYLVPLDHAEPDGQEISLALLRVPATGTPEARIGTLFVNPGGPGGSGRGFAAAIQFALPEAVLERFDVVGFDPRGVAGSSPAPLCVTPVIDADGETLPGGWNQFFNQAVEIEGAQNAACHVSSARYVDHLGTNQVADDLDLLRKAVGDEYLTYWGGSYGTRLGLVYAQRHPDTVRAMILDGNVDPMGTFRSFVVERGGSLDDAYAQFVASFPAAGADVDAVRTKLTTDGPGLIVIEGETVTMDERLFLAWISGDLKAEGKWPALAAQIADAKSQLVDDVPGDVQDPPAPPLVPVPDQDDERLPWEPALGNDNAMLRIVNCLDYADRPPPDQYATDAEAMVASGPLFGRYMAAVLDMCAGLSVTPDPIGSGPATNTPLLLVGTVHDPATPYVWSTRMAAFVSDNRLVTYEGTQHVAFATIGSACIDQVGVDYLVDLVLPAADPSCPFVPPVVPPGP